MEVYQKLNIQLNKQIVMERLQGDKSEHLRKAVGSDYERLLPAFLQWIKPEYRIQAEPQEKERIFY